MIIEAMNTKPTILIIDDEIAILELMRDFLEVEDFAVEVAQDGKTALALVKERKIDCVLLDVMLPDLSGFEVCRQLRELYDLPLLFLSARGSDVDKVRGLGLGGDDYIVKSATPVEVVARIKAVLRRAHTSVRKLQETSLNFGRLAINLQAHEVSVEGRIIPFAAREFALLKFLAQHPRQVFTHEQLFSQFWGEIGDRHTIAVHIARVREKIELDPTQPRYIVTVRGTGYRFEGELRRP